MTIPAAGPKSILAACLPPCFYWGTRVLHSFTGFLSVRKPVLARVCFVSSDLRGPSGGAGKPNR